MHNRALLYGPKGDIKRTPKGVRRAGDITETERSHSSTRLTAPPPQAGMQIQTLNQVSDG